MRIQIVISSIICYRLGEQKAVIDRWDYFNDLMYGEGSTPRNLCENHLPNIKRRGSHQIEGGMVKVMATQTPSIPDEKTGTIMIEVPPSTTPQFLILSNANRDIQGRLVTETVQLIAEPFRTCMTDHW